VENPAFTGAIAHLQAALGGGIPKATAFYEASLNAQATMLGLNDIFWISAVIFIVIIPLIWVTRPVKGGGAGAAGAGGH
jgi:DHA2 family multidrug resistance protein